MSVINRLSSTQGERAGSTFPVPVCTVPHGLWINDADNQQNYNKVDAARLYALYRLNLLLPKGQRCVFSLYKGTVGVIFILHVRFTTVPFKPLTDQA